MKLRLIPTITTSVLLWLPVSGSGAALGTRQRAITPVALTNAAKFYRVAE